MITWIINFSINVWVGHLHIADDLRSIILYRRWSVGPFDLRQIMINCLIYSVYNTVRNSKGNELPIILSMPIWDIYYFVGDNMGKWSSPLCQAIARVIYSMLTEQIFYLLHSRPYQLGYLLLDQMTCRTIYSKIYNQMSLLQYGIWSDLVIYIIVAVGLSALGSSTFIWVAGWGFYSMVDEKLNGSVFYIIKDDYLGHLLHDIFQDGPSTLW